jgi:hypothetical protein
MAHESILALITFHMTRWQLAQFQPSPPAPSNGTTENFNNHHLGGQGVTVHGHHSLVVDHPVSSRDAGDSLSPFNVEFSKKDSQVFDTR